MDTIFQSVGADVTDSSSHSLKCSKEGETFVVLAHLYWFLLIHYCFCNYLFVEVSASGWSLVQRSPTDCGTSLCANLMNEEALAHWGGWCANGKKITSLSLLKCEYLVSFETLFSTRKIFSIQMLWQNAGETEGLRAILPNQMDQHPKADGVSRHEREYFIVTSWGIEKTLGKRWHILLHCERKEWYSTVSLGIWNLRQVMERGKFLLCAEVESQSHPISTKLVNTTSYKLRIICLDSRASGKQRDRITGWVTLLTVGRITDEHTSV